MTHVFENEKKFSALSTESKLETLLQDIGKLYAIAEELNHKHHVIVDAIKIIHDRLDHQAKVLRSLQKYPTHSELVE